MLNFGSWLRRGNMNKITTFLPHEVSRRNCLERLRLTREFSALLQRAIKIIPRSALLYVEYTRLELIYRDRVKEKMKLGDKSLKFKPKGNSIDLSGVPSTAQDAEQMDVEKDEENDKFYNEENPNEDENNEGKTEHFISFGDENKVEGDPAHGERAKLLEGNPFLEGAILKVIFKKAIHGKLQKKKNRYTTALSALLTQKFFFRNTR